ncbi:hypothetical protein TNCV_3613811 [Trichonephila clavipes]|uniref:Uncharacterized protein n=1 Tax=Trichonephila clavipes TaxID=2585209 RepID=A0A8X6SI08_TRICX|nr:hypothetical protein TNCV_3613811 [Trichonephila clavipes]
MHNATVPQPVTTVSLNSNTTIVVIQAVAGFVSKHNVIPFRSPCPLFIAPLMAQTPVVFSQGREDLCSWVPIQAKNNASQGIHNGDCIIHIAWEVNKVLTAEGTEYEQDWKNEIKLNLF